MSNNYFYFKQFRVFHKKSVMKVGTDGVLLGAAVKCENSKTILDIGTGTGLIAIMLAQKTKDAEIHGVEINPEAFEIAKTNVDDCPWKERIKLFNTSIQDFCTKSEKKYDLIVSNPPFYDADYAAPEKGRNFARHSANLNCPDILTAVKKLLSPNGRCVIIYPTEKSNEFENLALENKFFVKSKLLVSSRKDKEPIRTILEISNQEQETEILQISIENNSRHDFSDEYKNLTKDFYINF